MPRNANGAKCAKYEDAAVREEWPGGMLVSFKADLSLSPLGPLTVACG